MYFNWSFIIVLLKNVYGRNNGRLLYSSPSLIRSPHGRNNGGLLYSSPSLIRSPHGRNNGGLLYSSPSLIIHLFSNEEVPDRRDALSWSGQFNGILVIYFSVSLKSGLIIGVTSLDWGQFNKKKFTISVQRKSGLIIGMASLEWGSLVIFYYLNV